MNKIIYASATVLALSANVASADCRLGHSADLASAVPETEQTGEAIADKTMDPKLLALLKKKAAEKVDSGNLSTN